MATTSPAAAPDNTGWTRVDALASSTVGCTQNRDQTQSMGLYIGSGAPGALAWNGDGTVTIIGGGEHLWAKAAAEQVWVRMETAAASPKPSTWERL